MNCHEGVVQKWHKVSARARPKRKQKKGDADNEESAGRAKAAKKGAEVDHVAN